MHYKYNKINNKHKEIKSFRNINLFATSYESNLIPTIIQTAKFKQMTTFELLLISFNLFYGK